jgi:hypothetical protein
MDESGEDLDRLNEELRDTVREFDHQFDRWTAMNVSIPIAPKRFRNFQMGPISLSWIVNLGNLSCFATGLAFIFLGWMISSAGVALLVGALFSEGAFLGQLWTVTVQSQTMASDRLWGDEYFCPYEAVER